MKHRFLTIAAFGAAALLVTAASAQAAPGRGGFHRGGGTRVIITGGFYSPFWGWGWGYPGYYGYGYGPYAYGYGYRGYRDANWGSVKTDVDPEEARVYLDGKYIGTADDFDGWPDKLYLRPGHYRLEFRLSGYEPKVLDVDARAGQELKVDDKLHRGGPRAAQQSDPPKIEGNVQRYFGKRRDRGRDGARPYMGRGTDSRGSDSAPTMSSEEEDGPDADYEENGEADRDRDQAEAAPRAPAPAPAPRSDAWRGDRRPADASVSARPESRRDRGRLKITVEPSDAVVYIDDRFVGSADEVTSMDRGIVVAPGKHTVTVSRPGYRDKTRDVTVDAGKTEAVEISLAR
ncbi:MAG TPA: PEGA domain-containing protein [Thermoanaerobaculia bacterium]